MIQVYSALWVIGDQLEPTAVLARLEGLHAKAMRRRGDLTPNGRPMQSGHIWIATDDSIRTSIEESLDDLFLRLDPVWPALQALSTEFETDIEAYVKVNDGPPDEDPYLGFARRHVRRAAEIRADLGIDYYDFRGSRIETDHPTEDTPAR